MAQLSRFRFRSGPDALKPLLLLVILVVAGPDFFMAMELTTLLELLGAALCMLAFVAGFRLLYVRSLSWIKTYLLADSIWPLWQVPHIAAKLGALELIRARVLPLFILCFLPYCWIVAAMGH